MDISTEITLSLKDAAELVAKLTGSQPQDLIDKIENHEDDLSTLDSFNSFIKPTIVQLKNDRKKALDSKYDAGFRKARKKSEEELVDVFQLDDIEGKDFSSMAMDAKNKTASSKSNNKSVTASQAFAVKEVKDKLAAQQLEIERLTGVQSDFDSYKNLQGVKGQAMSFLHDNGALWSKDKARRTAQEKAFTNALKSNKYRTEQDGTITILDSDGETPLHNSTTGENWTLELWALSKSPVDFGEAQPNKNNKDSFTPDNKGGNNGNNFGFSSSQVKNFTHEDWKRAEQSGDLAKANFILEKMDAALDE